MAEIEKGVDSLPKDLEILDEDVDENSQGIKHWLAQMGAGMQPNDVVNHFKEVSKTHK